MTFYFEISMPFQIIPNFFKTDLDFRFVFLWFSLGVNKLNYYELCTRSLDWEK